MNCTHCNKPIVLVPSAAERAAKYGMPASYYTSLFTMHSECQLKLRSEGTSELMRRLK
jgi:hypothetical protein